MFLPCPDNLVVNLKEKEELIRDLLALLPEKFKGTHDTNCALGAALQVAVKIMVMINFKNIIVKNWFSNFLLV